MEDILASIRRILSDDEQAAAPANPPPAPAAAAPTPAVHDDSSDVLPLSESMLVSRPEPPAPPPIAMPEPAQAAVERPVQQALVAPEAQAAAAGSVSELVRTLVQERNTVAVYRGGPTIEDLVREEIRPLLKTWLDSNLPPLVERLVRAEIERVVGRVLP